VDLPVEPMDANEVPAPGRIAPPPCPNFNPPGPPDDTPAPLAAALSMTLVATLSPEPRTSAVAARPVFAPKIPMSNESSSLDKAATSCSVIRGLASPGCAGAWGVGLAWGWGWGLASA